MNKCRSWVSGIGCQLSGVSLGNHRTSKTRSPRRGEPSSCFTFHVSRFTFLFSCLLCFCAQRVDATDAADPGIQIPQPGTHVLHVLTPRLLELVNINTKPPGGTV